MNAKFTALFVAITLLAPSFSQAGQAIGTAKARGDYGNYQSQGSTPRWANQARSNYRNSAPRYSAPVVREVPSTAIAQAPVEARRFSQAPAVKNNQPAVAANAKPCRESAPVASQPSSGRRYSNSPAPASTGNFSRSYSSNSGRSSAPTWSLPKTDSRKFNSR
jgi:hypothetical protein